MKSQKKDAIDLLIRDHNIVADLIKLFEGVSDKAKAAKKELAEIICYAWNLHRQVEDEVFYPKIRIAMQDTSWFDEAMRERNSVKNLIAQIQAMNPDDYLYEVKMKMLSKHITHHMAEDEEKIFPKVRRSGIDLVALAKEMEDRKLEIKGVALAM